jgi:hypothetical protein
LIEKLKELQFRFILLILLFIVFNAGMFLLFQKYNLNNIFLFATVTVADLYLIITLITTRKDFLKKIYIIFSDIAKKYNALFFDDKVIDEGYYLLIENNDYDYYDGKYYTKGKNYKFSYVKTSKEVKEKDEEGNITTHEETVYEGTIYVCSFFHNTKNRYFLKPNTFHLSDILPITYDKNRIKLDYPKFEEIFDVYGNDQIEGRMIFNHNFMNNLIEIYHNVGKFKMIIQNNMCILSFPNISPIPLNILNFDKEKLIEAENFYIFFLNLHKYFDNKKLII